MGIAEFVRVVAECFCVIAENNRVPSESVFAIAEVIFLIAECFRLSAGKIYSSAEKIYSRAERIYSIAESFCGTDDLFGPGGKDGEVNDRVSRKSPPLGRAQPSHCGLADVWRWKATFQCTYGVSSNWP